MIDRYKTEEISEKKKLIKNGKDLNNLEAIYLTFADFKENELFGFVAFGEDLLVIRYGSESKENFLRQKEEDRKLWEKKQS